MCSRVRLFKPIHHFAIAHNTPRLPPEVLHNHCFQILLGITVVPSVWYNFLNWRQLLMKFNGRLKFLKNDLTLVGGTIIYNTFREVFSYQLDCICYG